MNNIPLVSVVIPVYNTGMYVCNILNSIKEQTYKNIELIVVDDGSSDNSAEIVNENLVGVSFNWRLIQLENGGVSRARNKGIEAATGEWIFCPDSDDWVAPNAVEYLLTSALNNDAQCAFCEYKDVNEESISKAVEYDNGIQVLTQNQFKKHNMLRTTYVVIPGMIISREVFGKIRFDENCPYSEDTLYTWELIYQVKRAVWVKCDLYNYMIREGSKQHSLSPDKCLKAIRQYSLMAKRLVDENPGDYYAPLILPKFILAAMHVLARCNSYTVFKKIYKQTDRSDLHNLYALKDVKLSIFCLLYNYLPYAFFRAARIR